MTIFKETVWCLMFIIWITLTVCTDNDSNIILCCIGVGFAAKIIYTLVNRKKLENKHHISMSDSNYAAILALLGIGNITAFDTPEYIFLTVVVALWIAFDIYDKSKKGQTQ